MNPLALQRLACALIMLMSVACASAATLEELATADAVDLQWDVKIPLRDGVQLSATVYRPRGVDAPRPCLFTLTPYIAQSYHERGMFFASNGYPFLTVDVRGRGNSQGTFQPLIQERRDGYDVVEWLARQPYCNGKVSMWGGSYAGYDQWVTAISRPPHLATIVPVAAPYLMVDFPGRNNILQPYAAQWLTLVSGHTSQLNIFGDDAHWLDVYRRWHESGTDFHALSAAAGSHSALFEEWASHPTTDAYWDRYNPSDDEYSRLEIPILTITGIYDDDQPGALEHYRRYMAANKAAGRSRHYLVIGPWDHAGTRTPKDEVGGFKFGPASLMDLPKLHLEWYRWTMEGGPRPSLLTSPVLYYVTGSERWRTADSLEAITSDSRSLYLNSIGNSARDVYSPGALAPAISATAPDRYRYDPREPTLAAVEAAIEQNSLVDQRVQNMNRAQLVYQSGPMPEDTELSGFFHLIAFIAIDQPDTDFMASVYEVTTDGRVILLTSDMQRARYRDSPREPKPVTTQDPLRYDFSRFTFTSRLIPKGSRLRLVISAANSVYQETNYNAGGVVERETIKDARAVLVTVYHDPAHPSVLRIPLAAPEPHKPM
jgi:putative CocE/NonD family hydrolase